MTYETEFPFNNKLYSSCFIIVKTDAKNLIKNFDEIKKENIVFISKIRKHWNNEYEIELEKGQYIIIFACKTEDLNNNNNYNNGRFNFIFYSDAVVNSFNVECLNAKKDEISLDLSLDEIQEMKIEEKRKRKLIYMQIKQSIIFNNLGSIFDEFIKNIF
jgi:hypothetical protein